MMGESQTPYVAFADAASRTPSERPALPDSPGRCGRALLWLCGVREPESRTIRLNGSPPTRHRFPRNLMVNTKYTVLSFLPQVLFEQFRYFFNLYFLLVAVSQFFPSLQIGLLFTYIAPLVFVLAVTMSKEAYDDLQRYRTDREINRERYTRLLHGGGTEPIRAQDLKVGHMLRLHTNQRVPADMLLLRTSESSGMVFLRTDQLDGETDWKLRLAVGSCQKLPSDRALQHCSADVFVARPSKKIYEFEGDFTMFDEQVEGGALQEPLSLENTLWGNTVLASGAAIGLIIYTGPDTRSAMNGEKRPSKVASVDLQVNLLAKVLFALVTATALGMVATPFVQRGIMYGFFAADLSQQLLQALLDFARFMILFSSIIPISLRVALDMAKLVYKLQMTADTRMPGLQVRSSNLPEELGGIDFLLTDKTGTLTRNEMIFRKLHLGFTCLTPQVVLEIATAISLCSQLEPVQLLHQPPSPMSEERIGSRPALRMMARASSLEIQCANGGDEDVFSLVPAVNNVQSHDVYTAQAITEAILAIALCHNVSPVESSSGSSADGFQGASPDELALVQFAAKCGLTLLERTPHAIVLSEPNGRLRRFEVLHEMPFSAELKRMGVVLRDLATGRITFYVKGADTVMGERIRPSDWMDEEVGNLAREGLRTLVVALKELTEAQYEQFARAMHAAQLAKANRAEGVRDVLEMLQEDMKLVCVTAVEDRLQGNVRGTLEMLRDANVKTWMLTGDKMETARVIAMNASLVTRRQAFYHVAVTSAAEARQQLNGYPQGSINAPCVILDGGSLELCVTHHQRLFMEVACAAPTVICCRCSPTQKAHIVRLIRQTQPNARTAAIGDGGNDVGMIQAAHVGIGIEGREGRQAALAADFSLLQFSHLGRLVLWHGRNCYLRSATLSQFVIHRGLIISVIHAVFSALFYFAPIALYNGVLVAGYATIFTIGPIFSLVLDEDVSEMNALKFPELYRELQKRRYLSIKTFLTWVWKAIYQGSVIMLGSILLFEQRFVHVVGITFTALILTELIMVAVEVKRWHPLMLLAQVLTLFIYLTCIVALSSADFIQATFDIHFMLSVPFASRVAILTAASTVPIWFGKLCTQYCAPRVVSKLA